MAEDRSQRSNEPTPAPVVALAPSVADDSIRVHLLGPFAIEVGGRATQVAGGKVATLVVLLALHHGVWISRDRLIDDLWGDLAPADPATALRQLVARARRQLGAEAIESNVSLGVTSYRLAPGVVQSDLGQFHQIVGRVDGRTEPAVVAALAGQALQLVDGRPLDGLGDEPPLADLRRSIERTILDQRRIHLLGRRSSSHPNVVADLRGWVGEHPDDEAVWTELVMRLTIERRTSEALRAAHEARMALAEVGLTPGAGLLAAERDAFESADDAPFASRLPTPAMQLFGRDDDAAELEALIGDSQGGVISVVGPPGIGCSALVASVAHTLARHGRDVVHLELAGTESIDHDWTLVAVAAKAAGAQPSVTPSPSAAGWINRTVPAGTVLVLDFASRMQGEIAAVAQLVKLWPGPIVTARTVPIGLGAERALRLGPLVEPHATDLLRARTAAARGLPVGADELDAIGAIAALADGVPIVLELLARRLATTRARDLLGLLSDDRVDVTGLAIDIESDMSPSARRLLAHLAWIDGGFDLVDARRILGRPPADTSEVVAALGELVGHGLVEFRPTASAPYRMLLPVAGSIRSSAAATEVAAVATSRHAITAAVRGRQQAALIGTPDEASAIEWLRDRADVHLRMAESRHVPDRARRELARAVAHVLVVGGRAFDVRRMVDRLAADGVASGSVIKEAVVAAYYLDDYTTTLRLIEISRSLDQTPTERVALTNLAVRCHRHRCDFTAARAELAAVDLSALDATEIASHVLERGMVLTMEDRRGEAIEALTEARGMFDRLELVRAAAACDVYEAWCLLADGRLDPAATLLRRGADVAADINHANDQMFCRPALAIIAVLRGDEHAAPSIVQPAIEFARRSRDLLLLARGLEAQAVALRDVGDDAAIDLEIEAAHLRVRIEAPISPVELAWQHQRRTELRFVAR